MKRLILTLAIALGLAFGSFAITSSDVLACGGKDKGATTEDTTGTSDGTQSQRIVCADMNFPCNPELREATKLQTISENMENLIPAGGTRCVHTFRMNITQEL